MTDQIDLDQLEALAVNATPGPWHWREDERELLAPWAELVFGPDDDPGEADAEFIAATDPDTVRALIARVREAEAKLEEWQRTREVTDAVVDAAAVAQVVIDSDWLAQHDSEVAAKALNDAADAWSQGAWGSAPRRAERAADRLAAAQFAVDWLRSRAKQQRKEEA